MHTEVLSSSQTILSPSGGKDSRDATGPATHRETPSARASAPIIRPPRATVDHARYILGEEIARGGMGRVVEASDRLLGRTVAIKEALIPEGELRERFMRETRITARLEHPSIVPLYDAGTTSEGTPFYVMRRVTGRPLEELVHAAKTLDQRLMLLPHLLAAANAIAHAHDRGVLHRDIKPSNILVGRLGETVVIDWGLAKVIGEPDDPNDSMINLSGGDGVMTRVGSVVGTPGFMPPEQLKGEPVDARSDVYALGATLYFLLSRQPPHAAKTGDEMMVAALAGPPPRIRDVVPGLASELSTIVDKALAYEHGVRYADAKGLAEDLERFLEGQLVASHRYSPRERLIRFWRRHRLAIMIAASAALALSIGAWVAIGRVIEARHRADVALGDALERNELLELARARSMLATSPTAALALGRPLAANHWQEVAVIAMAARAAGVARGLPASPVTLSLEISRDGKVALAAGNDGVIRFHDLATRITRIVAELGESARATYADDERSVVAWTARRIVIIDASTGAQRVIPISGQPRAMRSAGRALWWIDRDGAVWTQGLDDPEPRALLLDDRVHAIAVHDGAVALAGDRHLWVARAGAPVAVADGKTAAIAWSSDGRVGAIVGEPTHVLELDAADRISSDLEVPSALSVAWLGGALYVGSAGGVGRPGGVAVAVRGSVTQLLPGPSGTLVARTSSQRISVVGPALVVDLPPTSGFDEIATGPAGHHVVAGSDGVVLMWNLDHVLPRHWPLGKGAVVAYAGSEQLAIAHDDHTLSWLDLRTETRVIVPIRGRPVDVAFAPDRSRIVVSEEGGRATLYTRGDAKGVELEHATRMAGFVDGGIVLGAPTGEIRLYDPRSGSMSLLFEGTAAPWSMESRGTWVAVLFDDSSLFRANVASGTSASLPATTDRWMLLRDGGDVLVSDRVRLRTWETSGSLVDGAPLPPPVSTLYRAGSDHVVAFTGGTSAHLVELSGDRRVLLAYPPGSRMHQLRFEGDLGAFLDQEGAIYVTAPRSATSWMLGRPAHSTLTVPMLSLDRSRVYAVGGTDVLIWKQAIPSSAAEVRALIDELTNAHMTPGARVTEPGSLRWRW